jgi:hypothetical protein
LNAQILGQAWPAWADTNRIFFALDKVQLNQADLSALTRGLYKP